MPSLKNRSRSTEGVCQVSIEGTDLKDKHVLISGGTTGMAWLLLAVTGARLLTFGRDWAYLQDTQ